MTEPAPAETGGTNEPKHPSQPADPRSAPAGPGAGPAGPSAAPAGPSAIPEPGTRPEPADDLVSSRHTLRLGRRSLNYTATAGRVVLREERLAEGIYQGPAARAEMFLTSYVAEGVDPTRRPVVFVFNGGPGSSSVWLHLGLFGPRRILMGDAGALLPPPYQLADNAESLLAHADLVFIDPVSTGYSRTAAGEKADEFHGYTRDLDSMGELIRLWTSRNGRWLSPKFLAGESYGTLRAAALAELLQTRYGMYCNGVMLISSVLNMATLEPHEDNDLPTTLFLPTFAAIAQHHGKHGRKSLRTVLREAEDFASRDYPWLLSRGHRLTEAERHDAAARLAELTGLSADYLLRTDLRLEPSHFYTELLRAEGRTVGRLDGRFTGWLHDGAAEVFDADPSYDAILGPYAAGINHYLRAELGYANDLPYEAISPKVQPWSYREFENRSVTVTRLLARAMRANPYLKVHVGLGYHDGATPYFAAEYVLAHLPIPPELRGNIESAYYPAGHMMYVHEPSRVQQSADLADFVRRAGNQPPPTEPARRPAAPGGAVPGRSGNPSSPP
ncbi:MAG TPA: peptidase S10 [Jatrophihabitans sp.]|nr:peptidase S10 [Jatrophihabitans sp.]